MPYDFIKTIGKYIGKFMKKHRSNKHKPAQQSKVIMRLMAYFLVKTRAVSTIFNRAPLKKVSLKFGIRRQYLCREIY